MSVTVFAVLSLLCLIHNGNAADCTQNDVKIFGMDCNPKTKLRKVVTYLANNCTLKDASLIKVPYQVPCTCPPGQGLTDGIKPTCQKCDVGKFSAGGEHISDWGQWTDNGTSPPDETGIITFCETYRNYVKPCQHWKASFFNDSLESGENSNTRCMSSIILMRKQFIGPENYVDFTYRVEGRKCYNNYVGCDGLAFFIDDTQVMKYQGNELLWKSVRFNVSSGYHQLKWVYRKNCYSFPTPGIADKAFLQSITLVGILEPKTKCKDCPPGTVSTTKGAEKCTKCSYFQYQPQSGKKECSDCPADTFSMPGSAYCIPMMNCTSDDLIMAPEPLNTCQKDKQGIFMREIKPYYSSIEINGKQRTLCIKETAVSPPTTVPCKCQPGLELTPNIKTAYCRPCTGGMMSKDGVKCEECPSGHVALKGNHYFWWTKDELPSGFSSGCAGDCPRNSNSKPGWIPSGDYIRSGRVLGDVDSYIQTDTYEVVSNIAYIAFNCSVICNMSQPTSRLQGNHLANLDDCNLVFEIWLNGSLSDQINCTRPKGKYIYKHERRRDGRKVDHQYNLQKGTYRFRWVFHQEDEMKAVSSAFEAKVYTISIVGVEGGSASMCTPCSPGYYSVSRNTDCNICPKGTYSKIGASKCIECPNNFFADKAGSGECLACGATTTSLKTRDGCTNNGCQFIAKKDEIEYDFSRLSRVNGSMFTVLNYQVDIPTRPELLSKKRDRRTSPTRLSIWPPYRPQFYLNLCTVLHDNTSCTARTSASRLAPRKSIPVMGCRTSWWSRQDTSIGRVIGFRRKKDIASGVIVDLLHGDLCYKNTRYNATIDLTCDVDAGVGSPGPENNHTQIFRPPCNYYFKWRSLYACPKCRKGDLEKVQHPCVNGKARITLTRKVPCWGTYEGMEVGEKVVNCTRETTNNLCWINLEGVDGGKIPINCSSPEDANQHVMKIVKVKETVNKVLIGVGVVVIVALLIVAGFFFYKHRDMKFKYYHTIARNKPMSRLEEEEEDFGQVEGDVFNDTRTMINS